MTRGINLVQWIYTLPESLFWGHIKRSLLWHTWHLPMGRSGKIWKLNTKHLVAFVRGKIEQPVNTGIVMFLFKSPLLYQYKSLMLSIQFYLTLFIWHQFTKIIPNVLLFKRWIPVMILMKKHSESDSREEEIFLKCKKSIRS